MKRLSALVATVISASRPCLNATEIPFHAVISRVTTQTHRLVASRVVRIGVMNGGPLLGREAAAAHIFIGTAASVVDAIVKREIAHLGFQAGEAMLVLNLIHPLEKGFICHGAILSHLR